MYGKVKFLTNKKRIFFNAIALISVNEEVIILFFDILSEKFGSLVLIITPLQELLQKYLLF